MTADETSQLFIIACAGGSAALFVWWMFAAYADVMDRASLSEERRSAIGSFLLLLVAPFANLIGSWVGPRLDALEAKGEIQGHTAVFVALRRKATSMLVGAGKPHELTPNEFLGLCTVSRFIAMLLGFGCFAMLTVYFESMPPLLMLPLCIALAFIPEIAGLNVLVGIFLMAGSVAYYSFLQSRWPGSLPLIVLIFFILGTIYPWVWLRDCERSRKKKIRRDLPFALDLLTLAVEAGLDFTAALARIIRRRPDTALSQELAETLRQIQMGVTRAEALRALSRRVVMEEVFSVTSALIQADELGASLGPSLRIQADHFRVRRAQAAEKAAMEAPVKLLFPLICFFFPATFIVLFGPVFLQFFKGVD